MADRGTVFVLDATDGSPIAVHTLYTARWRRRTGKGPVSFLIRERGDLDAAFEVVGTVRSVSDLNRRPIVRALGALGATSTARRAKNLRLRAWRRRHARSAHIVVADGLDPHLLDFLPDRPHARLPTDPRAFLALKPLSNRDRGRLRRDLGVSPEALVITALGAAGWEDGPDLVVGLLWRLSRQLAATELIWFDTDVDGRELESTSYDLDRLGLRAHIHRHTLEPDQLERLAAADALVVTHRRPPPGDALLAAHALGVPVVGFAGAGQALSPEDNELVPYPDLGAMVDQVLQAHLDGPTAGTGPARFGTTAAERWWTSGRSADA